MMTILDDYMNGRHEEAWALISLVNYAEVSEEDRQIVNSLIREVLQRIDANFKTVFSVIENYGFKYENFGEINTISQPYLVRSSKEFDLLFKNFITARVEKKLPVFFSAYCSYFKTVDFRGGFDLFNVEFLLDSLFIESFDTYNDAADMFFDCEYHGKEVTGCMFSPDQYIKENVSGDLGPCILVENDLYVDNHIVNSSNCAEMKFLEYLRFCLSWSCFPNLFWATDEEKKPFLPILAEVRSRLIPF